MKKIRLVKISYTSGNGNPTKFLIFSQNKAFLIFQKTKNLKKTRYVLGNRTFSNLLKKVPLILRK